MTRPEEIARLAPDTLGELDARALRVADERRVHSWILRACEGLAAEAERRAGDETTRLSRAVFHDAVVTAIPTAAELVEASRALGNRAPIGHVAMLLPSNVETAVVRPLVWALLCRDAVAMRVSSRCAGIAAPLVAQLVRADPALGRALGVLALEREDHAGFASLSGWADAMHAWGHAETIARLEASLGRRVVAHGSGLSLAVVSREGSGALDLAALARDVARHDQRGCLSPHAIVLEEGAALDATTLARRLFATLTELEARWPRGRIEPHEAALERSWRDTAMALADWVGVAPHHAVSVERGAIRDTPGLRNIAVHAMSRAAIESLLVRLGSSLKCVGVAEPAGWIEAAAGKAHVVPLGRMQIPGLLAPADGAPPWAGLVAAGPAIAEHADHLARKREP